MAPHLHLNVRRVYIRLGNRDFHRGIAKGEARARLARELGLGRKRVMQLRQRIQNNLYETLPTQRMDGQTFEADELYQNAGEKRSKTQ